MLRQFQLHDLHDLQVLDGRLGHQNLVAVLPGLQMLGLLRHLGEVLRLVLVLRLGEVLRLVLQLHLGEVLRLVLVLRLGVVGPCPGWKKMDYFQALPLGVECPCLGWKKMGCCPALVFRSMGSVLA